MIRTMTRTPMTTATPTSTPGKKPATRVGITAACFALLLAGRVNAQSTSSAPAKRFDKDVYAELSKAPKKALARPNPLERDPDAVLAGGKLYEMHCMECHGDMADGGKKGPSLRAPEVQQSTPGTLFWLLTNGVVRRGMPVWSKLPEPQRWQLVTYIKSLTPSVKPNADGQKPPQEAGLASRPPGQ
jgi:mono/diheme cytochrome c family protein